MAGRPKISSVRRIVAELMGAIGYIHLKSGACGALSPSAVMITSAGSHVRLIDVGIGDEGMSPSLRSGVLAAGYAAPELFDGATAPTPLSDIYSLGMILGKMDKDGKRMLQYAAKRCVRPEPSLRQEM